MSESNDARKSLTSRTLRKMTFSDGGGGTLALVNARAPLEHGLSVLALLDLYLSPNAREEIDSVQEDFQSSRIMYQTIDVTNAELLDRAIEEVGRGARERQQLPSMAHNAEGNTSTILTAPRGFSNLMPLRILFLLFHGYRKIKAPLI
ncbi:MAG: hypothetical protein Q9217_001647 [Psora testacea]